jgi:hypothetical protein
MAKKGSSGDRIKKIVLVALFAVMAVVAVYRLYIEGPAPRRRPAESNSNQQTATAPAKTTLPVQSGRPPKTDKEEEAALQAAIADLTPLDFSRVNTSGGSAAPGARGNIFAVYVEPVKIEPPPPPPPIALQFLQPQTAVAGTPRNITLTVTGRAFPADAQIQFDGRAKPTSRVNETTLTTDIAAAEYSSARSIKVEVKSQSDPAKFYSNPISFIVQPTPEPPFRYTTYFKFGDWGLFEIPSTREVFRLRPGDTIQNVWRIDSINEKEVEVTHTQYDIKRRIAMVDKSRS